MTKRKSQIVAVIPARHGSTRLPGKPLIKLCGKPMVQHVYERVKAAKLVDRVIVATDDDSILETVHTFGGEAVMTPKEVRTGSDRIAIVAKNLPDAGLIVNVQGDEPLIDPRMVDEAIKPLVQDKKIRVGTLVKKITSAEELSNPNVVKVVLDQNGDAIYFSRSTIPYLRDMRESTRWHLEYPYFKHIGLYVFRRDFLLSFTAWDESPLEKAEKLEQLRIIEHGVKIHATITEFDSIPVDTVDDVTKVERCMARKE